MQVGADATVKHVVDTRGSPPAHSLNLLVVGSIPTGLTNHGIMRHGGFRPLATEGRYSGLKIWAVPVGDANTSRTSTA